MSYEVKYNSRNKKYMVFYVKGTGFGSWKIKKGFDSQAEADQYIASQK